MKRDVIALNIKPNSKNDFKNLCKNIDRNLFVWSKLVYIKNISIWCIENIAFIYCEVHNEKSDGASEEKVFTDTLIKYFKHCCEILADPINKPMRLMYEDIGMIRKDKTLIHHRVFVTKLKPGCSEEYKRRHDLLAESRRGIINEGPDSNFTIWNCREYIFGYCERVKSMEREQSEEEKKATIDWETHALEIMDWITDDMDWLTGLKHDKIELMFQK